MSILLLTFIYLNLKDLLIFLNSCSNAYWLSNARALLAQRDYAQAELYAVRVLQRYPNGRELQLFLKDFSASLRRKNDPRDRREREVRVYQDLLVDAGIGTARCYGSLMDEAQGRLWLLLGWVCPPCYLQSTWIRLARCLVIRLLEVWLKGI